MNPDEVFKIENLTKRILELEEKLQSEKEKVEKLKRCVEFYADKNNWLFSGMYCNVGKHKIVDRNQAIDGWHDENKSITNLDIEIHNESLFYGGKLARRILKEVTNDTK